MDRECVDYCLQDVLGPALKFLNSDFKEFKLKYDELTKRFLGTVTYDYDESKFIGKKMRKLLRFLLRIRIKDYHDTLSNLINAVNTHGYYVPDFKYAEEVKSLKLIFKKRLDESDASTKVCHILTVTNLTFGFESSAKAKRKSGILRISVDEFVPVTQYDQDPKFIIVFDDESPDEFNGFMEFLRKFHTEFLVNSTIERLFEPTT